MNYQLPPESPWPEAEHSSTPFYTPPSEEAQTSTHPPNDSSPKTERAAHLIQRNYRGYRERRQLAGIGTDALSRRWAEVRLHLPVIFSLD